MNTFGFCLSEKLLFFINSARHLCQVVYFSRLNGSQTLWHSWEGMWLRPFQGETGRWVFFPVPFVLGAGVYLQGGIPVPIKIYLFDCYHLVGLMNGSSRGYQNQVTEESVLWVQPLKFGYSRCCKSPSREILATWSRYREIAAEVSTAFSVLGEDEN